MALAMVCRSEIVAQFMRRVDTFYHQDVQCSPEAAIVLELPQRESEMLRWSIGRFARMFKGEARFTRALQNDFPQ